jgi:hypothetical protein
MRKSLNTGAVQPTEMIAGPQGSWFPSHRSEHLAWILVENSSLGWISYASTWVFWVWGPCGSIAMHLLSPYRLHNPFVRTQRYRSSLMPLYNMELVE